MRKSKVAYGLPIRYVPEDSAPAASKKLRQEATATGDTQKSEERKDVLKHEPENDSISEAKSENNSQESFSLPITTKQQQQHSTITIPLSQIAEHQNEQNQEKNNPKKQQPAKKLFIHIYRLARKPTNEERAALLASAGEKKKRVPQQKNQTVSK